MALQVKTCTATPTEVCVFYSEDVDVKSAVDRNNFRVTCPLYLRANVPLIGANLTYDAGARATRITWLVASLPVGQWVEVYVAGVKTLKGAPLADDGTNAPVTLVDETGTAPMFADLLRYATQLADTGDKVGGAAKSGAKAAWAIRDEAKRGATAVEGVETQAGRIADTAAGIRSDAQQVGSVIAWQTRRVADATEAMSAYPLLTEGINSPGTPRGSATVGGASPAIAQSVEVSLRQVLGWKPRTDDPKGFVSALTQSFALNETAGHTVAQWQPRTYAVQTDLSGGITGAQASIYTRAKGAIDESLRLLDGLVPLRQNADPEDTAALKSIIRMQLQELVQELGVATGPRIARVDQMFTVLLGGPLITDPDLVAGQVGTLREELGLGMLNPPPGRTILINTVDEEQNATSFRILVDHLTSLRQSWISNRPFFQRGGQQQFFGLSLVRLTRQLSVIAESVEEVRFAMDSVFLGPDERQTQRIEFPGGNREPMFIEELLEWAAHFASAEAPQLIQDGGKYGVRNSVLPMATELRQLVDGARTPTNPVPPGYGSQRVQRALRELTDQLRELETLAQPITHQIPSQP